MKSILAVLLVIGIAVAALFAAETTLPTEVHLTTGAVLRHVSPVRFEHARVVLRHAGGVDPVAYTLISEPDRAAFEAARDAAAQQKHEEAKPAAESARTFKGEIFIATKGGENRKLGDVDVYAFSAACLSRFDTNMTVELPAPLAHAVTDSKGQFTLSVPGSEKVFLFVRARRYVGAINGQDPWEHYVWRLTEDQISNPGKIELSNRNLIQLDHEVTIAN